ncbi:MarR family winged helix-turn-helix transcriptional regulator [Neisseria animalis]|uniref:MarR family transcriptional regulator n=1 Tax=Neisseria animalis TaxID=492 RepID=A0A5P3MR18_NEIAN|nr:helix-turn-helix domain-containing protein [Neisseria animalis]QEY24042.1 MarR family transcriptional regulator [Neisseria animalis]ROW32610.1 MarR family transcriptional regulator [Neisseria animalis]VEE06149.1 MarR family [Neisseria animalis]
MNRAETLSRLITRIFHANGAILAWGDRFAADFGLTSARWQMLGALVLAGEPQTSPQIAERMGISRQGAQKQLNLLVADGMIEQEDNPAHKRSPLYALTDAGRQKYAEINKNWLETAQRWAADTDAADLAAAEKVLEHLVRQAGRER